MTQDAPVEILTSAIVVKPLEVTGSVAKSTVFKLRKIGDSHGN